MLGKVIAVGVAAGQKPLALEAMKLEHTRDRAVRRRGGGGQHFVGASPGRCGSGADRGRGGMMFVFVVPAAKRELRPAATALLRFRSAGRVRSLPDGLRSFSNFRMASQASPRWRA